MIPVQFILTASTASFTRGMATAENQVRGLKKTLASLGGGGVTRFLGLAGVTAMVRGFLAASNHAQDLRDEAEKAGKAIDDMTHSVAGLADGIDSMWAGFKKGAADAAIAALSVFTQLGDGVRRALQGVTKEQEDAARKAERDTAKALEETLKRVEAGKRRYEEDRDPERLAEAERELAEVRREGAKKVATEEDRIRMINEDNLKLQREINAMQDGTASKTKKKIELEKGFLEIGAELKKQADKIAAAEEKLARTRQDGGMRVATTEERIRLIAEQKKRLEMEIAEIADGQIDKIEKRTELAQLEVDLVLEKKQQEEEVTAEKEKQAKIEKDLAVLRKAQTRARVAVTEPKEDQAVARADNYLPSIDELAAAARKNIDERENYGIGSDGSLVDALDPNGIEMRALKAVEAEEAAKAVARDTTLDPVARLQQASQFQAEAEELRGGLTGFAQSSDTNTAAEFKKALSKVESELEEANESLKNYGKALP